MRIDIHSHLMNAAFLEHLQGRGALPTAVRDGDGFITHCTPQFSVHYRPPILSVEAKLADMDAAGIDLAVLSPGPPSPAVLGGALADAWAARINDELAVIAAAHPGRFAGWGSLGFGDPARTIAEVDRCLDELGLAGFQVWSNVAGRRWTPRACCPSSSTSPAYTSLAVLRLIGAGLFDRNPVIVAAHLGGVLTWLRERLGIYGQASPLFPTPPRLDRPVGDYLDQLYVDTVGYGPGPLEYCYAQLGAGRLLFGTDHPYGAPSVPGQLVDRLPCTPAERRQILAGNEQRLLRPGIAVT